MKPEDFKALLDILGSWSVPKEAVDGLYDAARASLYEVKALTEYEDGKVSRLLTIVAFLSALVGAVFTRFANDYAWPGFILACSALTQLLPALTYILFFAYVLLVTWSVYKVLGAVRPRFNVPASWRGSPKTGLPGSMIFYEKILDVSAPDWGKAFQTLTGDDSKTLKEYYAKNCIGEAYLVAGKVAEKLKILQPGINALRLAMIILLLFFALYGVTLVTVTPINSANPRRTGAKSITTFTIPNAHASSRYTPTAGATPRM
jgi:hypothetical protein